MAALSIKNTANLDIAEGVTLTVGDGTHPAGVIVNMQTSQGGDAMHFLEGKGTLDFGSSPGILWASSPTMSAGGWGGNRRICLSTRVTGSAGVTFASGLRETGGKTAGIFNLAAGCAAWTGPTRVCGCLLWPDRLADLPAGDIYVLNGVGLGGSLRLASAGTLDQNLFLAGSGCFGDGDTALELPNGYTTFNGLVTLTDDAWIGCTTAGKGGAHFKRGVMGPGSLYLTNAGTYNFYEPCSYAALRVLGSGTAINLYNTATFGTGLVWVRQSNVRIGLNDVSDLSVTNRFVCDTTAPILALNHSTPAFDTDARFSETVFTNFSSLAIGGRVDLGAFTAAGARDTSHPECRPSGSPEYRAQIAPEKISASRAGAEVLIGTGANGVLSVPLVDGAGTLAFTKKGAGTLEMPAGITNAYSGATKVEVGTLKLNDDPLQSQSLVWWLDASREEDFEKSADGTVTKWHSRAGSGNQTFTLTGGTPVWGSATMNGLPVVKMTDAAAQLKGDKKSWHRTVFTVCRFDEPRQFACLFGASTAEFTECGIRINGASSSSGWDLANIAHYVFNTTGWSRSDGRNGGTCGQGVTHVLTTIHDRDNWTSNQSWAQPTIVPYFTPTLNYYGKGRPFLGDYAEVIAFDRVLSEVEVRRVENYLADKWQKTAWTDGRPPAETEPSFAGGSLSVAGGVTVDLGGADLTVRTLTSSAGTSAGGLTNVGTLTVAERLVINVVNGRPVPLTLAGNVAFASGATAEVDDWRTLSTADSRYDALTVTGTVTGDVKATLGGNWRWSRSARGWIITKSGLFIIFR